MSRSGHEPRLILALVGLLSVSLGVTCEDFVADPGSTNLPITLKVEIEDSYHFRNGYVAIVNLMAISDIPVQACDLTLSWKASNVSFATAIPHPPFDDDGVLFSSGQLGAKSLSHIVDLRHGSATAAGNVRLASVAVIVDDLTPVKLTLGGELATSSGERFKVVISESATVDAGS